MKRHGSLLALFLPLALAGCGRAIPGVTHSLDVRFAVSVRGLELSPDGLRLAYCVETVHFRRAIGLAAFPDGGIEHIEKATYAVYTYDLATRQTPTLVGHWRRPESNRYSLWSWDGRQVVLAMDDGQTRRYERIDTITGRYELVARTSDALVRAERERLHPGGSAWDESRRRHVECQAGEFLLWDPEKREYESLFELPRVMERDSVTQYAGWLQMREGRRRAYTIHQAWDCTARSEDDSVWVTLETFVPQPGRDVRAYRFWYSLRVPAKFPDPVYGYVSGYRDSELVVVTRWLGPEGQRVTQAFSSATLTRIYDARGRGFHEPGRAHTAIEVRFAPLLLPGDDAGGYPGIYGGDGADAGVEFDVP